MLLVVGIALWQRENIQLISAPGKVGTVIRSIPKGTPLPRSLAADSVPAFSAAEALSLRALLIRDADSAERILSGVLEEARGNVGYELRAWDAVAALREPTLRPALDAWVTANPASVVARLARADHRIEAGYDARGEARRAKDPAAARAMMDLALDDLREVFARDQQVMIAYAELVRIGQFYGEAPVVWAALRRATRIQPTTFIPREYAMLALVPRWAGAQRARRGRRADPYARMQRVADAAQREASANPALRPLIGYADWDRADVAWRNDDSVRARELLEGAFGLGPSFNVCFDLADVRWALDDDDGAMEASACAVALRPSRAEARVQYARLRYRWDDGTSTAVVARIFNRTWADIDTAFMLDSSNQRVRRSRSFMEAERRRLVGR